MATGPQRRPWFQSASPSRPVASTLPPAVRLYTNAAYYPNWRVYRNQPPSSLKLGVLSHVFYAFVKYARPRNRSKG
jgi:GH18 family chitinase